jgi:hypothetical protein
LIAYLSCGVISKLPAQKEILIFVWQKNSLGLWKIKLNNEIVCIFGSISTISFFYMSTQKNQLRSIVCGDSGNHSKARAQ